MPKWFLAIYLMSADKGRYFGFAVDENCRCLWPTAQWMLRKLRRAMGGRDRRDKLSEVVQVDDTLVGGQRPGKRGRGADGKRPVLLAVERCGHGAGYLAVQTGTHLDHTHVRDFSRRLTTSDYGT